MKKFYKTYIPALTITFTLTILFSCIWNLICGSSMSGYFHFVLELLIYLAGTMLIDALLHKIDFKSYFAYFLTEAVVLYPFMLLFAYLGQWFTFTPSNLLPVTIFFVIVVGYIHYYSYKSWKIEADEINQLLEEHRQS